MLDIAKAYLRDGSKGKAREMLRKTDELNDPKSYERLIKLYGEAGREMMFTIYGTCTRTQKRRTMYCFAKFEFFSKEPHGWF
ncbi:hypothetical protein ISN44_As09g023610 [Arabidopsis suecica]|uniref:Uncharacterized protein n=1 Tax=Arabidopsis suecica TaxID=45249 RepID=A0A8T2AN07_ARASU|nr:hypothetical protein ISN44_As09g023610 [Arabidopsis suecica]